MTMRHIPRVLTIAGSDSGGGAGIQADLKTFQEWMVFGMSAVTAVTAQNSLGVHGVWPLPAEAVVRQLRAVLEDFGADAVKTGMLANRDVIRQTAGALAEYGVRRLVVDPVMVAKGGAALLEDDAVAALTEHPLPLAELVTPNVPEARRLAGMREIATLGQMAEAARRIHRYGVRAVLIKGGHLPGPTAEDLLYDGKDLWLFRGPRIRSVHTHGTGCTLSAAIAASLARGRSLPDAVREAKDYTALAIRAAMRGIAGRGIGPLDHAAGRRMEERDADAGRRAGGHSGNVAMERLAAGPALSADGPPIAAERQAATTEGTSAAAERQPLPAEGSPVLAKEPPVAEERRHG